MPSTLPSKEPVARNDSSRGIRMVQTSCRAVERADGEDGERRRAARCRRAPRPRPSSSAAARSSSWPAMSPVIDGADAADQQVDQAPAAATGGRRVGVPAAAQVPGADPASTSMPGGQERRGDRVREGADARWSWSSTAPKSVSSARPALRVDREADRVLHPGVRGQDEVGRQHGADRGRARCRPGARRFGSRSQPKIHRPRKVDSRKNASSPSMASGAPKMSPTKRE